MSKKIKQVVDRVADKVKKYHLQFSPLLVENENIADIQEQYK